MSHFTIVIPTYDVGEVLSFALNGVSRLTDSADLKYIIVANGEAEGKDLDIPEGLDVNLIIPDRNLGWMEAVNIGVAHVDTPFVAVMNDDVVPVLNRKFWETLKRWLNLPRVGMVVPMSNFVYGMQSLLQHPEAPDAFETTFAVGLFYCMSTQVFIDLEGLDNRFLNGDDIDMCRRLASAGYRIICDRNLYVHHVGGMTTSVMGGMSRPPLPGDEAHEDVFKELYPGVDDRLVYYIPIGEDELGYVYRRSE